MVMALSLLSTTLTNSSFVFKLIYISFLLSAMLIRISLDYTSHTILYGSIIAGIACTGSQILFSMGCSTSLHSLISAWGSLCREASPNSGTCMFRNNKSNAANRWCADGSSECGLTNERQQSDFQNIPCSVVWRVCRWNQLK